MVPSFFDFGSTFPFASFLGLASLLAWVRKILSPQTTGVELPGNSSGAFQRTFSLPLHLSGTFVSAQWPCPVGPRHAGQLSARALAGRAMALRRVVMAIARAEGMAGLRAE